MNGPGSAVVQTLEKASLAAWKKWRQHVEAGTADTPEALAAFDEARLAGATWLGEVADRGAARPSFAPPANCGLEPRCSERCELEGFGGRCAGAELA